MRSCAGAGRAGRAAALAFVVGVAIGAGGGDDGERPRAPAPGAARRGARAAAEREAVDELPLTRQVGRLVVLRFNGTSAPGYVREVLGEGRAAGRDPVPRQPHRPRADEAR